MRQAKSSIRASAAAARCGRPPAEFAGEVEARILDAAAEVFLERGFDGASIDLIAETARAGKPTIYARYADKEALFAAAFLRQMAARNARLETHRPAGATIEHRLQQIGVALIEESLAEDFVGLMRLAIAEARRRPELAGGLFKAARERGGQLAARLLVEGLEGSLLQDEGDPRALAAGQIYAELVLVPFLLRALAQLDPQSMRAEIAPHVRQRTAFFLAALRNGGLAD